MWLSDVYLTYFILNCYGCCNSSGELHACDRYSPKNFSCPVCNHRHDFLATAHCRIFVRVLIAANQKPELQWYFTERIVISCSVAFEELLLLSILFQMFIYFIIYLVLRILDPLTMEISKKEQVCRPQKVFVFTLLLLMVLKLG